MTVISTSEGKRQAAMKDLGAHHFLVSKDKEAMEAAGGTLDGIIDTARLLDESPLARLPLCPCPLSQRRVLRSLAGFVL